MRSKVSLSENLGVANATWRSKIGANGRPSRMSASQTDKYAYVTL